MIARHLAPVVAQAGRDYPVVTITGPRQSGKTTLAKAVFPNHPYVTFELSENLEAFRDDPKTFFRRYANGVIIDEAQRAPELFSYIQVEVDQNPTHGRFILIGSHNFLLMKSISQSLAGRCAILHLLPFSLSELCGRPMLDLESLSAIPQPAVLPSRDLFSTLHTGFYPRIHDQHPPV